MCTTGTGRGRGILEEAASDEYTHTHTHTHCLSKPHVMHSLRMKYQQKISIE